MIAPRWASSTCSAAHDGVTLRSKAPVRLQWMVPGGGERQQAVKLPVEIPMAGIEAVLHE